MDSHALVGSCAQIGTRVHLSAAAQIGGVLEPVGALPVIIEDDVLVGGNCGVYEGTIVKTPGGAGRRHDPDRVDAACTTCRTTGSSSRWPGRRSIVPEGAVVVPGTRPVTSGRAAASGACRSRRRSSSSTATRRRRPGRRSKHGYASDRRVRARADRHRFDDRTRAGGRRVAGRAARGPRLPRRSPARRRRPVQRLRAARRSRRGLVHALRLRAAVLSERRARRRAVRPRLVRREGDSRRAGRGGRTPARRG